MRGNVVTAGYYDDPEATATAMRGGWFHSGDAAVVHPDGYVEIRDRFKDVIISGGENISSVEVEGVMMRHPAICEIAVVGVPDERWGETPHAFVVLNDGASAGAGELIAYARHKMAHFKAPRRVTFVDQCRRRQPARSRSTCCGRAARRSASSSLRCRGRTVGERRRREGHPLFAAIADEGLRLL